MAPLKLEGSTGEQNIQNDIFSLFFEHLQTVDDDVPFSNYIELVLSTVVAALYRHALAASVPLRTPLISL